MENRAELMMAPTPFSRYIIDQAALVEAASEADDLKDMTPINVQDVRSQGLKPNFEILRSQPPSKARKSRAHISERGFPHVTTAVSSQPYVQGLDFTGLGPDFSPSQGPEAQAFQVDGDRVSLLVRLLRGGRDGSSCCLDILASCKSTALAG